LLLSGLIARLLWPDFWPAWAAGLLLAVGLGLLCWRPGRACAFVLLGLGWGQQAVQQHRVGLQDIEERVLVEAEIVSIPQISGQGASFTARLYFPREPLRAAQLSRVSWSSPKAWRVHAGERWQLLLRLRPPRASFNPGAVDMERNYLRDHIQSLAAVINSPLDQRLLAAPASWLRLRERLARQISAAVPDPASGALLAALAVGETGEVTREQWRVFNATGITHLVAISGMHVTLFAVLAMAVVRRLWRVAARCGCTWPRERCAAIAGIALASGYSLLAGFSVPTQRTLIMLSAWLLWRECARASRASSSLAVAVFVVVLWDPFAVLAAGFWLSFIAVAAIIGIAGGHLLPLSTVRTAVTVQLAVFVALLPVTVAIFGSVSVAGLLVNVGAIPLFTYALVPVALGSTALLLCLPAAWSAPLVHLLLRLGSAVADFIAPLLSRAADSPQALWLLAPPVWWYPWAALAVLLLLLPWPWTLRSLGVLSLWPLLAADARPPPGHLAVSVLDVGQSTAVLLQTRQHVLLYGTGDTFGSAGGSVERTVLPYARLHGVRRLDRVIVTRLDRDSGEGVGALQAALTVGPLFAAAPRNGVLPPEAEDCSQADVPARAWIWDGWRFQWRSEGAVGCVLHIAGPGGSVLLAEGYSGSLLPLLPPDAQQLDAVLLPRRGNGIGLAVSELQAQAVSLGVASLGRSAAAGTAWQMWSQQAAASRLTIFDTARDGAIRLQFAPQQAVQWQLARTGSLGVWHAMAQSPGVR
jgi:competence protein ComEC